MAYSDLHCFAHQLYLEAHLNEKNNIGLENQTY